jgi:6-phospho-3-hexuloisomerase
MSGPLCAAKDLADDVKDAISSLDEKQVQKLVSLLIDAKKNNRKVFLMGEGLSDLVARAFALRLAELTFNVYVIGETVTSAVEKNDLFIAITRSGVTPLIIEAAGIAKDRAKAKIIAVTSTENSPIIKLADYVVMIKSEFTESEAELAETKAAESYLNIQLTGSILPSYRTVFQIAATCLAEAIVKELSLKLGIDGNQQG